MTQQKMTKRQFLRAVGGVAGVAATYHAMNTLGMLGPETVHAASPDLPRGSGYGKRVVILGAGISGMTAAYELLRAGYHCTILEATDRAGGRNLTARAGDVIREVDSQQWVDFDQEDHLYANLGPARIPYHHRAILGYCKEFGIELEVFTNDNRGALFHNVDRFGGEAVVGRRVTTDLRGYVAELLAKAVNRNALDSELTGDDKERVLGMLVEFGDLNPDHLYKGSSRGGYRGEHVHAGLEPGDANDPLDFSELLRSSFWEYKLHFGYFLDQNPTLLQPVGGMDAIARAFEQRVGPLIQYGSIVEEIRKTQGGARIVYQNQRRGTTDALDADFVICTIPAPVLKDIPNDFSSDTQAAIESVQFVPAVKIAFQTRRRFWEEDQAIYGGISWTDQDITQIWYPAAGYHRNKGVILGAYIWWRGPGLRYTALRPYQRVQAAIAEGEHLHPGYANEIEAGVSRAWAKVPFQKGGWPGDENLDYSVPERLRSPEGAIYFAGDQLSGLTGWQEGAVLATYAAVEAINARVMAEGA
jgi:monoamine oxidase